MTSSPSSLRASNVLFFISLPQLNNQDVPPVDPTEATLVFLSFSCMFLLMLTLIFLTRVEKGASSSKRRDRLEYMLWIEATLLAVLFSWQAAEAVASTSASVIIWATTAASSSYFFNEIVSTKPSAQMISK